MSEQNAAKKTEWERQPSPQEIDNALSQASRVGARLVKTKDEGTPGCWLGGQPSLPEDLEWPVVWCDEEEYDEDFPEGTPPYPMHFLGQIDLGQLPPSIILPDLPQRGTLFFFIDPITAPTGSESYPPVLNVKGRQKVIYCADDISGAPLREMPEFSQELKEEAFEQPLAGYNCSDLLPEHGYFRSNLEFQPFTGYEDIDFDVRAFSEAVSAETISQRNELKVRDGQSLPQHMLAGGNAGRTLVPDHVRLFSAQCDRDLGFKFSGGGWAVFWIHKDDLAALNFENVHTTCET